MPVTGITFPMICYNFLEIFGKHLSCLLAASLHQPTEFLYKGFLKDTSSAIKPQTGVPGKSGNNFFPKV
jgi:hypothetical protein